MRLFLDECLSPRIAQALNESGEHVAVHPRDSGGLGQTDHCVLAHCVQEVLVIATENARDFRALVAVEDIHPGLIIVPCLDCDTSSSLIMLAIAFLEKRGEPMDVLVNHVLEVDKNGQMRLYPLPD